MRGRRTIVWGNNLHNGKNNKIIHHGLRWPPFSGKAQQPTNSQRGSGVAEVGDEARGGLRVPSFGAMICRMEKQ